VTKIKRSVSLLFATLLVLAGALFVASPAQAIYPDGCPTSGVGNMCFYRGYFVSMITYYPGSFERNKCINRDGRPEDATFPSTYTYSLVNTTQVEWRWFRDSACAGASIYIYGHTSVILPSGWTGLDHASILRTSTVG
jgi:hypothetical protein